MKTLILIRHATAESRRSYPDYSRKLIPEGVEEAKLMSDMLSESVEKPDVIISSSADRALETAQIFARKFSFDDSNIIRDSQMYDSSLAHLITRVTGLDQACRTAFLCGHNPEISLAVNYFCGDILHILPKCGIVVIRFEIDDWSAISRESGLAQLIDHPKNYR